MARIIWVTVLGVGILLIIMNGFDVITIPKHALIFAGGVYFGCFIESIINEFGD